MKKRIELIKKNIDNYALFKTNIIAATKMQNIETLKELNKIDKDIVFAENRVQEFLAKYNVNDNFTWDFIGQLQTNKVKYLIGKIRLIHSVDREALMKEIDKCSKKNDCIQECLIQINAGNEDAKSGISFNQVESYLELSKRYPNMKVVGFMIVTPLNSTEEELTSYFSRARMIFNKYQETYTLQFLSMGMSNDYVQALANGSNMIRLGRIIFGERNYCN